MFLSVLVLMYIYPTIIKSSVIKSLNICYKVLIPSIFPYIAGTRILSEYIIKLIINSNNSFFKKTTVINVLAIIIGLISGFPNGAIIAARFYNLRIISKEDAEKIVALSNCISPSFCIIYFGKFVLDNIFCGVLIFLSIVLSNLFISVIFKKNKSYRIDCSNINTSFVNFPQIITDCCHIMLDICAFVTFFMCFGNLIMKVMSLYIPLSQGILSAVFSLLEITSGVMSFSGLDFSRQVLYGCVFLSFTGVCAITQVATICDRTDLSIKSFLLSKIISSILTPIVFILIIKIIPDIYLVSLFALKRKKILSMVFTVLILIILPLILVPYILKRIKISKYIKN